MPQPRPARFLRSGASVLLALAATGAAAQMLTPPPAVQAGRIVNMIAPPPAVMFTPAPAAANPEAEHEADGEAGREIVVQSGWTLSSIAKKAYGDSARAADIFEANRDRLSDPDRLEVGQTLRLP